MGLVLLEDPLELLLGALGVEDPPVAAHVVGQGGLEGGVDHYFLELCDDLVEEPVFGGTVEVCFKQPVL